jgi:hypothetical protein
MQQQQTKISEKVERKVVQQGGEAINYKHFPFR